MVPPGGLLFFTQMGVKVKMISVDICILFRLLNFVFPADYLGSSLLLPLVLVSLIRALSPQYNMMNRFSQNPFLLHYRKRINFATDSPLLVDKREK